MISLEDVSELNELSLSYSYVNKKKIRTFLKARQMRINITCKMSYEAALRNIPKSAITHGDSLLLRMVVILN